MLIVLCWHQVHGQPHALSIEKFEKQLRFLKKNFPLVSSPENLQHPLNVLLTFDDATIDFYHHIFPLLRLYAIPATLAIPTGWIDPRSSLSIQERLQLLRSKSPFFDRNCFCTIEELKELQPFITFSAHGHLHKNLKLHPDLNEIYEPIRFFQAHFNHTPDRFIFPYGAFDPELIPALKKSYRFLFRIGTATNSRANQKFFYRIVVDQEPNLDTIFTKKRLLQLRSKEYLNRLCAR